MRGHAAQLTSEPVANEGTGALVSAQAFVLAAVVAIIGAEALIAFVDPLIGVALDAVIIAVLAGHRYVFAPRGTQAPPPAIALACVALSLLPILRLLSFTLPAKKLVEITWYELIGAPILAVLLILCRIDPDLGRLARNRGRILTQGAIASTGIPLGLAGFLITREPALDAGSRALTYVLGPVVLVAFAALTEELLFRGAVTVALERIVGPWVALAGSALMFAAFHLDGGHLTYVPFAAAYGLAFGLAVRRTGSLTGVAAAHGLLNVGMIVVWPHFL